MEPENGLHRRGDSELGNHHFQVPCNFFGGDGYSINGVISPINGLINRYSNWVFSWVKIP